MLAWVLVADGFENFGFLVYVALIIAGALGSLLKKKTPEEREPAKPRTGRPPRGRAPSGDEDVIVLTEVPDAPQAPPPPPPPPRPVARPPQARPPQPRPAPAPPRPVKIREPAARPAPQAPQAPRPQPAPAGREAAPPPERALAQIEGGRTRSATAAEVRRLLRSPVGVRAVFVAAEILGPPVGLRDLPGARSER